jgi:hypothetical protein
MKKVAAVLAVALMVVSLFSLAFAADMQKGTVKAVDERPLLPSRPMEPKADVA